MKWLALRSLVAVLGFVMGVAAIFVYQVRGRPSLERWHTVELSTEFTARKRDKIRTFDDYLRLEEALFAELDKKIYARTETGPAFHLARYSTGSAADPRRHEPNWNRSFELPGAPSGGGVLLLHGMSDSPYSLRALGERLHQHGYWVVGVRLPGHGTAPSGLKRVAWEDMAAVVRLGMARLASRVGNEPIHIIGYSTGAPLALDYVLDLLDGDGAPGVTPASLVLISPAIGITRVAALAGWMDNLARLPGLGKLAWESTRPEFDPYKYNSFTNNAGYQVHRLTRAVAARLEALSASGPLAPFPPTLVFLSAVDATVSVDAVIDNLLERLGPGHHKLVLFDINRSSVRSTVLVSDPGPLTSRLLADDALPFHLELITNESPESTSVVSRRKPPFSDAASTETLDLDWPQGLISLSHVALQFPPDDPLYGRRARGTDDALHLGQMAIQGERGLLKFPSDWLLRVRHNPFYDALEARVLTWMDGANSVDR